MEPRFDAIQEFLEKDGRDSDVALTLLTDFLGELVELFCGHPSIARNHKLIMRELLSPSAAFDILYEKIVDREFEVISRLIMAITGDPDERKATYQAFLLMGQIIMFRQGREAIVRRLGLHGYDALEIREIRQLITEWAGKVLEKDSR